VRRQATKKKSYKIIFGASEGEDFVKKTGEREKENS